jgi:hypothetical protein
MTTSLLRVNSLRTWFGHGRTLIEPSTALILRSHVVKQSRC